MLKHFATEIIRSLTMRIRWEENPMKKHRMALTAMDVARTGKLDSGETFEAINQGEKDFKKAQSN